MLHDCWNLISPYLDRIVLIGVIILLLITIAILIRALLKKESALQLQQFSISTTGLQLIYEMNKDDKLRILIEENILLKKEVEAFKSWQKDFNLGVLFMLLLIFGLVLYFRFTGIFSSKKSVSNDEFSKSNFEQANEQLLKDIFSKKDDSENK